VSLTTPGQRGNYTFTANSGTQVTARYANSTIGCLAFTIIEASGATVSTAPCTSSSTLARTLTSSGTHTIRVDPNGTNTGTLDLSVTSP
jgi:hypothetical protein